MQELRGLWPRAHNYVLDSTADPRFDDWPGLIEQDKPPKPLRRGGDIQVWRPSYNDLAAYDTWFQGINDAREPAIILVDELASILSRSGEAPQGYTLVQKQGRKHDMCVITLSQEMAGIARQAKNQATHMIRCGLQAGEYDARVANVMIGRKRDDDEPPDKYGFWYVRLDQRPKVPVYYKDMSAFF